MQFWKKLVNWFNILILAFGLLIPLMLFLNRFLIPDVSFDSINYHLYLGFKEFNGENNKYEFYPTGIHNFSSILEVPGYILTRILGYRLGSIGSLIFLYLSIWIIYKIFRLYQPKFKVLDHWWWGLLFVSSFLSFEAFLQVATYFIDIETSFFTLLGVFLLLKYERFGKINDLVFSAVVLAVLILGKMTAWYFIFPYFGYLLIILTGNHKINWKQKILRFLLAGVISLSFALPMFLKNYNITSNPVFPFYNEIFKSRFFPLTDFSQMIFGGKSLVEKIGWSVYSAITPTKLGEVHDLFHDYRINIFFITTTIVLVWSIFKRNKSILKLSVFYLATYLCWAYFFGYLRYGLVLEFWGGLILILFFAEVKGLLKYLILFPTILLMIVQGKRVINMSLAYDLAFRPGYFYNRGTYLGEIKNFGINKINVDGNLIAKYKPNVYLNCSLPNMSYYVLSDIINRLPVLNIDLGAYGEMTTNENYYNESQRKLRNLVGEDKITFVTIAAREGLNNVYGGCIANLKKNNYEILQEQETNFLGFNGQKLRVIFGVFKK